jgi:hypothetical protein
VKFHALTTTTLSGVTGTATQSLNPQNNGLMGALAEVGDQFDLFKVIQLEYRIHPMDPADTTEQVVCFYPDVDIQTQTPAQAAQSPLAAVQTPFCGVPSAWMRVPRSQLNGMLDWYKCTPDSGSAEFELQGIVQICGGLSDVCRYEFRGVVLFKNPVSSSLQAERAIDRAVKSGLVVRVPPTMLGDDKSSPPTKAPQLRLPLTRRA